MFRSGLEKKCPGLKLGCLPHIGHFNGGQDYKLARTLSAVRFTKEPHEKIPPEGFEILMKRDNVMDIEVYLALYDMQDLRDWLSATGKPYAVNLLFAQAGDWMINYHTLIPDLLADGIKFHFPISCRRQWYISEIAAVMLRVHATKLQLADCVIAKEKSEDGLVKLFGSDQSVHYSRHMPHRNGIETKTEDAIKLADAVCNT